MTTADSRFEAASIAELLHRAGPRPVPPEDLQRAIFAAVHAEWRAVSHARNSRNYLLRFWWRHERLSLLAFLVLTGALALTSSDLRIAHALFFDSATMRWIGTDNWWISDLVHIGGRWLIRGIVASAFMIWMAACIRPALRTLRRPAAYFTLAATLSVGIVGLLKITTNIDCPWSLTEFGGHFAYVSLFEPRLGHHAQCFPAAHASSGYVLVALYFVFRERHALLARLGLGLGIAAGLIFGIAQQSRGAHFVSHDVWSAFLTWTMSLTLYTFGFAARLWD